MAENKTKATNQSVSGFISAIESEVKRTDSKALVKLMRDATGEPPKLWGPSIVGFGSRHYHYESGREGDTPMLAFSPRKPAIVLYGIAGFEGADALLSKLGKHTQTKGCVYVKKLADVDLEVLQRMLAKSLAAAKASEGCVACGK